MHNTFLTTRKTTLINMLLATALGSIAVLCPIKSCLAQDASTLPAGEKVIGGNASFDRTNGNTLNITQKSNRLLIDWSKGFNIGEKATTNFIQPNAGSIVINRVTAKTNDPTLIQGRLNANGHVIILDRNGVMFSKSAVVDVGGLVVSTGKIKDKDFLNGKGEVTLTNFADGEVINAGSVTVADAGLAAFVAPRVRNDGLIVARKGTVLLGNAKSVTLDLYGDGLLEVDTNGNFHDELIENDGKIDAEGGRVLLTAAIVDKVVKNLVNMSDIKNTDTFKVEEGKIILGYSSDHSNDDVVTTPNPEPVPTPAPVIDPVVVVPEPTPAPVITPVIVPPITQNQGEAAVQHILNHIVFGHRAKANRYIYNLQIEYTHHDENDDWYIPARKRNEENGTLLNTITPAAGADSCSNRISPDCLITE